MDSDNNNNIASRHLFRMAELSALPREKALKNGLRSLDDAELIAILLGTGIRGKNVIDLANEILKSKDGHLSELAHLSVKDMTGMFTGIGSSKALSLLAAVELGRRAAHDAAVLESSRRVVNSSSVCYDLLRHKLQDLDHEEFWVLLLNNSLKRITELRVSEGASNFTVVEVKKIIKAMIDNGANHVVLYHNHPSGKLRPSPQDDSLTRKIAEAAKLFDFKVIDHIIICNSGFYSYSDNGRL